MYYKFNQGHLFNKTLIKIKTIFMIRIYIYIINYLIDSAII